MNETMIYIMPSYTTTERVYHRCPSCWGTGKKYRMLFGRVEWLNEDCSHCKGKGKWYENVTYWN